MCGILGIVGKTEVTDRLVTGLKRLEYRGYDSAGAATLTKNQIHSRRAVGKIVALEKRLQEKPLLGAIGLAHTRWATHGGATEKNAHPHSTEDIALVHNGIIENHEELRQDLHQAGYIFKSETDTEVIVGLMQTYLTAGLEPLKAVQATLSRLRGAYALGILFRGHEDFLIGVRCGSPLVLGYGEGEMYLGSDPLALSHLSGQISYLEEGDVAVLTSQGVTVYNASGYSCMRTLQKNPALEEEVSKGVYAHFMLKEIYEHPQAVRKTLAAYWDRSQGSRFKLPFEWSKVQKLTLVACGTAYYACWVAKYWFEKIARLPVDVEIASEFRYRMPPLPEQGGVALFVSQSGETADTLAAQAYAATQGQWSLGIINVSGSSLMRAVDVSLLTYAGVEIGVASTKAFTTQLTLLALLALDCAQKRGILTESEARLYLGELFQVPDLMTQVLTLEESIKHLAHSLSTHRDIIYLGRGTSYGIALEGALKMKELSYIHAEGYAAGEMKHGPIALIEQGLPVIVVLPSDDVAEKTASNVEEARARGASVILFTDQEGARRLNSRNLQTLLHPPTTLLTSPLIYAVSLHLLAYHTAVFKGNDVDQPRNLAKSVTVE